MLCFDVWHEGCVRRVTLRCDCAREAWDHLINVSFFTVVHMSLLLATRDPRAHCCLQVYTLHVAVVPILSWTQLATLKTCRCSLVNAKVESEFSAVHRPAALSYCRGHCLYTFQGKRCLQPVLLPHLASSVGTPVLIIWVAIRGRDVVYSVSSAIGLHIVTLVLLFITH